MPYRIDISVEALEHLTLLTARERTQILDAIEQQLLHQPTMETRNRKRMRPNPLAAWELRIGSFRVYYDVAEAPGRVVDVRAVGVKQGSEVRIGNRVVQL